MDDDARLTTAFDLAEARAILERTPAALAAMLGGLPPAWTTAREGPGTWSPHEVMAHLINGDETDWIPRAAVVLSGDSTAVFPPFDREGFFAEARTLTIDALLDRFSCVRSDSLQTLDRWQLSPRELDLSARHPEFGAVTLRQLLATWVAHDLGHVVQVARTMARRYRADVGPWRAYLGVVR